MDIIALREEIAKREKISLLTGDDSTVEVDETPSECENQQAREELTRSAVVTDDLPIFTATAGEINLWHASVNFGVMRFLHEYDLGDGAVAFDSFKIGMDKKQHAVTFALDDTHYLKFELRETNDYPLDVEQAEKVLSKINSMRFEKNKNWLTYCCR